jgi:hypothetical protein
MLKNPSFVVSLVTVYLLIYTVLFHTWASMNTLLIMFVISPFLVIWMVYVVLKYGQFKSRELSEDEEWGYCDRSRDTLGTF